MSWLGSRSTETCSPRSSRSPSGSRPWVDSDGLSKVFQLWSMATPDPITLRNRLLVATSMWKETVGEPLPKMAPGEPAAQIAAFEIQLVDRLWESATPDN